MARHYVIDSTKWTAVATCKRCPWRCLTHSKPSAFRLLADHVRRHHDDDDTAEYLRRSAQRCHRGRRIGETHMPAKVPAEARPAETPENVAGSLWDSHNDGTAVDSETDRATPAVCAS